MGNKLPAYSLEGKTMIVTGANVGIGFATAAILARMGAHVVMACRSEQRGKAALDELKKANPKASLDLMLLDLSDFASIQSFVEAFTDKYPKLHVLVNNAGMVTSKYSKSKYGLETMLSVNHLGPFVLTNLLRSHLEKLPESEGPPRVVVVASDAHSFPGKLTQKKFNFDDSKEGKTMGAAEALEFYGLTKLCNILFVRHLAKIIEQDKSNLKVFSVHPGWVETELGGDDKGSIIRAFESMVAKTPEEGAQPSVFCACDPNLVLNPKTNGGYYSGINEKGKLKDYAKDDNAAKQLWEWTTQIVDPALKELDEKKNEKPKEKDEKKDEKKDKKSKEKHNEKKSEKKDEKKDEKDEKKDEKPKKEKKEKLDK